LYKKFFSNIYRTGYYLFAYIFIRYINIQWTFFFCCCLFSTYTHIYTNDTLFFLLFSLLSEPSCVCVFNKRKSETNKNISHCRNMCFSFRMIVHRWFNREMVRTFLFKEEIDFYRFFFLGGRISEWTVEIN
jgi:hypothetical protein